MKNAKLKRSSVKRLSIVAAVWIAAIGFYCLPIFKTEAAPAQRPIEQLFKRSAPNFDYNLSRNVQNLRRTSAAQLSALQALKSSSNAPNMQVRWNEFGGSPDAIFDFASRAYEGTPEEAGRAFLSENAALFGIADVANLRVFSQRAALGGHLIRFQQTFNGIAVKDGGIGLVMNANKQVIMASGPYFRDVAVNTSPTISAAQASAAAGNDINRFKVNLASAITSRLQAGLDILSQQAAPVNNLQPQLGIYPTADGYKLVWKVAKFSTNPFGLYMVAIDAHSGQVISRKDFVSFQSAPGVAPMTADIYPKYPTITQELKDQGIISDCSGTPCGQERVNLRSFDPTNRVTGLNGTLTGTHAIVNNALATKQPFAQAALGTWHFRQNNTTGFEGRTNEVDHFAEPAEHQDEINAFFFVTYLLEYIDHVHVAGDPTVFGGQGAFPDDYPNKTIPLTATVHIPNVFIALDAAGGTLPNPSDPDLVQKILGLDNAFALNVTSIIEGVTSTKSPVVVNPTAYGHGYLLNNLALEGTVPYHEGMHAITSPIAGLEGDIEGSAMNEGQADMWAFTITDNPSLGDYAVNSFKYRQLARDRGRNPDSIAYIRSAHSTLKYSDIGTLMSEGAPIFEEHYDGEIYMSTMWDIREMFNRMYPEMETYKRPRPKDGLAEKKIARGTDIFERDFLGAMYILGTTSPDTMVKARDAMIVADQMLYSSDASDPAAPGKHRAMIEQVFAAHELGINAVEVTGGQATISTQVSHFAGNQQGPAAPSITEIIPASPRTLRVSWEQVNGATAYQVLKREVGFEGRRKPNGKRAYADGDENTTGFRHVAFVGGSSLTYEDRGPVHEVFAPEGINDLYNHQYVVRAIAPASNGQLAFSDFSEAAIPAKGGQELTSQVDSAISNITFANGVMAFDNKITNARGAIALDKSIYQPIEFRITNISNPLVTVKNADTAGNTFVYNQSLALGQTSAAKRFEFNNPAAQIFSFDAKIYGGIYTGTKFGGGSGPGDGTSEPPAPVVYSIFRENKSGALVLGDPTGTSGTSLTWGDPAFKGITWEDIEVTTKDDALRLEATLSSQTAVDLDLELRTMDGMVISDSAGATAAEKVSASVQPNTTYILRVKGFANGPATFNIVSDQYLPNGSPNGNSGTSAGTGGTGNNGPLGNLLTRLVRFTVNPLTKKVTLQLLQ